ncbi:MAG: cysteine desulfurase family protein [Pacificimonas sp.]|jgi:cysteine desulfurase|nr:cysteine desulfurase family protein [Pacificimonas sp.]
MSMLNTSAEAAADRRVYLDWNATAPMRAEAQAAVTREMERWANPSSVYAEGRAAKGRLEDARDEIATALGLIGAQLVFTSGGTEALALALRGLEGMRVLVSAAEHSAVLEAVPDAERLPVGADGLIDEDHLRRALRDGGSALVAVMHANNETGVIQPVGRIADIVRDAGGLTLSDCVQSAGKLPLPPADMVVVSGHKLGGPPGVGLLAVRCAERLSAVQKGGGQERGLRGGTENLPAICGMAAAVTAADRKWLSDAAARQARMEAALIDGGGKVFGKPAPRLANTTMVRMPGIAASSQLMQFDLAGFSVSSGAACSSGKVGASHVLSAMGVGAEAAREAIRVSTGWTTTDEGIERFIEAWHALAERRRAA